MAASSVRVKKLAPPEKVAVLGDTLRFWVTLVSRKYSVIVPYSKYFVIILWHRK